MGNSESCRSRAIDILSAHRSQRDIEVGILARLSVLRFQTLLRKAITCVYSLVKKSFGSLANLLAPTPNQFISESHHLPRDMIEAILARLPVKSLLKFQSVSKSWKSTIWTPFFCKIHQRVLCNPPRRTFMCRRESDESIEFCLTANPKVKTGAVYEAPFSGVDLQPCCSCNGVVLLVGNTISSMKSYILLNPATGMYKKIECPYEVSLDGRISGLCFDREWDYDFKIVVVSGDIYFTYSCKNGIWSQMKTFMYSSIGNYSGICGFGKFYMVSARLLVHGLHLVRFDSRHDTFILLPKIEDIINTNRRFIVEHKGRLYISMKSVAGENVQTWSWELVEGSWIKHKDKFNIDDGFMNQDQPDVSPPGWENCLRLPRFQYVDETLFFPFDRAFSSLT